jgi:hypothetical protein
LIRPDTHIANDPTLTGMNNAWFGAFAALHFAGYQPHAAGSAVTCAAVVGQLNAVTQGSVEQHLAAAGHEALAIDSYLMMFCHCPILKAFFVINGPKYGLFYGDNQAKSVRQSGGKVVTLLRIYKEMNFFAPQNTGCHLFRSLLRSISAAMPAT